MGVDRLQPQGGNGCARLISCNVAQGTAPSNNVLDSACIGPMARTQQRPPEGGGPPPLLALASVPLHTRPPPHKYCGSPPLIPTSSSLSERQNSSMACPWSLASERAASSATCCGSRPGGTAQARSSSKWRSSSSAARSGRRSWWQWLSPRATARLATSRAACSNGAQQTGRLRAERVICGAALWGATQWWYGEVRHRAAHLW